MDDKIFDQIHDVDLKKTMETSYIDYAMSVIASRALPDVRDGMKPVHRRIIYTMNDSKNTYDKPYRKCAYTVGEVLGKYHPHGDASVYDALVRLAQKFSLRYPLIESMVNQTIPPEDFVLYCDGLLTNELYEEIDSLRKKYSILNVIYNETPMGLGNALNNGLKYCKNDIVARMDSDDIAVPERMELQLEAFIKKSADIISGNLLEFTDTTDNIINEKNLPETDGLIREYSKRRNPFNHPCT